MIEGKKIMLGGEEYTLPPLNIATLKKHKPFFDSLRDVDRTDPSFDVMADIVFCSLKRNYPDMTQDRLDELLDINNITEAFQAVMTVAGFEKTVGEPMPGSQ